LQGEKINKKKKKKEKKKTKVKSKGATKPPCSSIQE
jgi:hypothetical protein